MSVPKYGVAFDWIVSLSDPDDSSAFVSSPTIVSGDVKVLNSDRDALENCDNLPTAVGKAVPFTFSADEMENLPQCAVFSDQTSPVEWCDLLLVVTADTVIVSDLNDIAISDIFSEAVEGSLDLEEVLRIMLAALAGKSTGGGTTSVAFRDQADTKNRIAATVDSSGNRSAMSVDGS